MLVTTYNVNGVNGRLPRLLEWLDAERPDIACLQELRTDDSKFPAAAIAEAGYASLWHGQRAHHGVAILARDAVPIEVQRGIPGEDADVQARYLEARVHGLRVASIYLPNGNPVDSSNYAYKRRWFTRLVAYTAALARRKEAVVLAGDLNVIPTDFDIYNADRWRFDAVMQPEIRGFFAALGTQGWIDTARALRPESPMYTYWISENDYRRGKGWRLDFLLVNAAARDRVIDVGVHGDYRTGAKPSDHAPAWLRLADE